MLPQIATHQKISEYFPNQKNSAHLDKRWRILPRELKKPAFPSLQGTSPGRGNPWVGQILLGYAGLWLRSDSFSLGLSRPGEPIG